MRSILSRFCGPPTREQFARRLIDTVRSSAPAPQKSEPIAFDAEAFALRFGHAGADSANRHTLYLNNAYTDYCRARGRRQRREVLRAYSATTRLREQTQDLSLEQAKSKLLPRVRERFYYAAFDLHIQAERAGRPQPGPVKPPLDGFAMQPFNDQLTLEVVLDLPDAIKSVGVKQLQQWKLDFDQAVAIAKENLWHASNESFQQPRPGLYLSPWRDTHDASRLFLHDLVWQLKVKGQHVAAIPNRNVLLVTGSDDHENLAEMASLVDASLQDPRPMTGTVFRLDGSRWVSFLPPVTSPAFAPLHGVATKARAREYAEQKQLLEKLFAKTGRDVYVAAPTLMQTPSGRLYSWTSWVEGITDALMPEADYVVFGGPPAQQGKPRSDGFAPWARVREILADRMTATVFFPPRWQVKSYPDPAQRSALQLRPLSEMGHSAT